MRRKIIIALIVLAPAVALAAASQLTTSFKKQPQTGTTYRYQLIRCDNSSSITGNSPAGGETCESGDWSPAKRLG